MEREKMTCENCDGCARDCICLCHSPELIPKTRAPKTFKRKGYAFVGVLAFVLLQSTIRNAVKAFLNMDYGLSTLSFLYAAFLWWWGMPHINALLLWMFRR